MNDPRAVMIHNKAYLPVSARVEDFRNEHGTKYGVVTTLIENTENRVVIKTEIMEGDRVIATGHAEEFRKAMSKGFSTSCMEVCETSSLGRALANFGYLSGGEYASADELVNALGAK
jgi:hypothetical protein